MAEGATTFAGLVGKDPEEAKLAILGINADLEVEIVGASAAVTLDLRTDRVRIVVGEDGKVAADPAVG